MRTKTLALVLGFVPGILAAQSSGGTGGSAGSSASGQTSASSSASATANLQGKIEVPASFSAEGRAKLEAVYQRAQKQDVPTAPIAQRVSEGQAKGATEASILASASRVEGNLETAHQLMVSAGRSPTPNETASGANALDRGVTRVQLETMVTHTQPGRPLSVAFSVLSQLAAQGVPVTEAVAQVQAKLDAGVPDAAISALTNVGIGRRGGGL